MLLELERVKKNYDSFSLDCSMEVKEGCVTGLIGANGAGKSTTFKAILNLIRPDSGTIRIFGKDAVSFAGKDKEKIGVVLSDSTFSGYLKVSQVVKIMEGLYQKFDREQFLARCKKYSIPLDKKIKDFSTGMKEMTKEMGTKTPSNEQRIGNLSGGNQQKALLGKWMFTEPDILILDEPTSGLDVVARDEILDLFRSFMEDEKHAILISSHISSDLEGLCDDIYMIQDGKIIMHEETDILLDSYGILKVDERTYNSLDKQYLLRVKKETFGYSCLTGEKSYYLENYPGLAVEKGTLDEIITMAVKGERI